jgi:hypothetical protein
MDIFEKGAAMKLRILPLGSFEETTSDIDVGSAYYLDTEEGDDSYDVGVTWDSYRCYDSDNDMGISRIGAP